MHLLILLLAFLGLLLTWRWLQGQPASVRRAAGIKIALGVGGTLVLLGVLTGRLSPMTLLVTAAAAIPLLGRLSNIKRLFDRAQSGGTSTGTRSSVASRYLEMTLDHDTGEMEGRVISGRYEGRSLGELDVAQLMELLHECQSDNHSVRLLEAYLDRVIGDGWRERNDEQQRSGQSSASAGISVEQAREILGVDAGVDRDGIIAAHRSLMQKLHPDRGGTTFLASQVNQAKKVLLGEL